MLYAVLVQCHTANLKIISATLVNKTEVECLIREFYVHVRESAIPGREVNGLDRGKFRSLLHTLFGLTDDIIMDGGNPEYVFMFKKYFLFETLIPQTGRD